MFKPAATTPVNGLVNTCEMSENTAEHVVNEGTAENALQNDFLNISKLFILVRHKYAISTLLSQFFQYLLFITFFAVVVYLQRNANDSSYVSSAIYNKFIYDKYRDSATYEILGWLDVQDFGNFWDFHQGPFVASFYEDEYISGKATAVFDRQMIQTHIKYVGGFRMVQRRAKNGTCPVIAYFSPFDARCYGYVSPDGLLGSVDKSTFSGAHNLSTYTFQQLPGTFFYLEEGYYQASSALPRLGRPSSFL